MPHKHQVVGAIPTSATIVRMNCFTARGVGRVMRGRAKRAGVVRSWHTPPCVPSGR